MPETPEELRERQLRELEGKNIAFYAATLQTWLDSRMEKDKTVVTLASAGVGLLVTLLTTAKVAHLWELLLYLVSAGGFLTAIHTTLRIFNLNTTHLERVIRGTESSSPILDRLDKRAFAAFMIGAGFFVAVAVVAAYSRLENMEMNTMRITDQVQNQTDMRDLTQARSVNGVGNLVPSQSTDSNTQSPSVPTTGSPAAIPSQPEQSGNAGAQK